eukprot:177412-Pelagomonas_calceolata.AAC.1
MFRPPYMLALIQSSRFQVRESSDLKQKAQSWASELVQRIEQSSQARTLVGIKKPEVIAIPSVRNDAAFLATVTGEWNRVPCNEGRVHRSCIAKYRVWLPNLMYWMCKVQEEFKSRAQALAHAMPFLHTSSIQTTNAYAQAASAGSVRSCATSCGQARPS